MWYRDEFPSFRVGKFLSGTGRGRTASLPWRSIHPQSDTPMARKKILVIDDEVGFTRLLKLVLRRYEILEENNSRRALETARFFRPDLILLDVIMPGLDGGNLAAAFQEDPLLKRVPLVFLTAVVSPSEAGEKPKVIGGIPFLAKPISPVALEQCIEEHLPG